MSFVSELYDAVGQLFYGAKPPAPAEPMVPARHYEEIKALAIKATGQALKMEQERDQARAEAATDGPTYNAGRLEGHADVAAKLRALIDPFDQHHLNLDGLLAEVDKARRGWFRTTQHVTILRAAALHGEGVLEHLRDKHTVEEVRQTLRKALAETVPGGGA